MAYTKQTWVDRLVQYAKRFTYTDDSTYLTLTPAPGTITAAGTPVDASRLNHMEDGIESASYGCPVGEIKIWPAAAAPTRYLLCAGAAVSRATYADLFALIGTTYGVGDGSTTFNLPNLKGKVVVGLSAAEAEFDALGETGGAKTVTLNATMIPAHDHALRIYATTGGSAQGGISTYGSDRGGSSYGTHIDGGGGLAHNNIQPYITLNYIIRALN